MLLCASRSKVQVQRVAWPVRHYEVRYIHWTPSGLMPMKNTHYHPSDQISIWYTCLPSPTDGQRLICSGSTQDQSNLRITHRLWTPGEDGLIVRSSSPADYRRIYAPASFPLPHTAASAINYSVLLIIPWSTIVIWTCTSCCTCPRFSLWRNELEIRRYHGATGTDASPDQHENLSQRGLQPLGKSKCQILFKREREIKDKQEVVFKGSCFVHFNCNLQEFLIVIKRQHSWKWN